MTGKKELRPPQDLVDAIQASGNMTAPESAEAASALAGSINIPRTVRNRLAHEEFAPMTEEQKEARDIKRLGADEFPALLASDQILRQGHMAEMRHARNEKDHDGMKGNPRALNKHAMGMVGSMANKVIERDGTHYCSKPGTSNMPAPRGQH